ncbi:serine hydrolase domain-containing protein [Aquimarina brevivitae]|uniref:CubicO group peptidase (Beta-lactamase class C family) n=1 Tax=Aquimarina brevivitae TaxID=323412 RepID=A0A4Q7P1T8_9FLAO|nr:serine hydrolase domain-containing protein [Aquimarina brevivitae]RZS93821.1 CubicO group peptidase (beta-lactamase class C family) [Aquimarina brevivitae]
MKYTLLLFVFVLSWLNVRAQLSTTQQTSIDAIFAPWNRTKVPGAAVGIIKDSQLIFAKGYGAANLDYDIPNSPQTVFRIASTSKQFTAACIVLLAQQNKLSLEDKLIKYFPDFPDYANTITIRHLLNHTSGIRDYLTLANLAGFKDEDHYTDKTIYNWLSRQQALNFTPGEAYVYSNSGYWLLGQIVKLVSGESLSAFAKKNIFEPLQMENTHFHDNHKHIVKNRAIGYSPTKDDEFLINTTTLNMVGDGGVFTTILDLKKWDDAFYTDTILDQEFWKVMTNVGRLHNGQKLTYASGLDINQYKGLKVIQHGGAMAGYRAEMLRFPEQHFSVIILANRSDARPTEMAYEIADIFLEKEYLPAKNTGEQSNPTMTKKKSILNLPHKELKKFEGRYWNAREGISRTLRIINDTLCYVRDDGSATKMLAVAKGKFLWPGYTPAITLQFKNTSEATFVLNIGDDTPMVFKKYTPQASFSTSDFSSYTGTYYSKELDSYYVINHVDNELRLYIKDEFVERLVPIMNNVVKVGPYLILSFTASKNRFRLSTGRAKNISFKKLK